MKKRQKAYRKHFQVSPDEDIPLVVLPAKVDLFARDGDTDRLIEAIKAVKITMTAVLRVVFIDTLATATIGADENSGKDMSVVLANIARIEEECGVHVCLVHQMNADGKKLRGHTSIHANVDTVILVTKDENTGLRNAKLTKQKDDEDGLNIPFTLASVVVGQNPKTEREITSCVVLTVSEKEKLKKEEARFGFPIVPSEEALLIPLFKAIKKYGKFVADDKEGPAEAVGKHVVDFSYYLDVAAEMDSSDNDKTAAKAKIRKSFIRNTQKPADRADFQISGIDPATAAKVDFDALDVRGRDFHVGVTTLDDDHQPMSAIIPLITGRASYLTEASPPVTGTDNPSVTMGLSVGFGITTRDRQSQVLWSPVHHKAEHPGDLFCDGVSRLERGVAPVWPRF